jgi:hypothetical protein
MQFKKKTIILKDGHGNTKSPCRGVAAGLERCLSVGFPDAAGAVSIRSPDRDLLMVKTLLPGEAA